MTLSLANALVWDTEAFPNCWIMSVEALYSDFKSTWEISQYRDDRAQLFQFLDHCIRTQTPMIGFNSLGYDYLMLHFLLEQRRASYVDMYARNQQIFKAQQEERFGMSVPIWKRKIPQIDLFKVHHFDNKAKTTSLKALEINMRAPRIVESAVPFGTVLTPEQISNDVIPYCQTDVGETKRFAHYSVKALEFRTTLIDVHGVDVMNYNDVKIGSKIIEKRLGDEICYDTSTGRKKPRQSPRYKIPLRDIIFPNISFTHPEFQRIHAYMLDQVLTPDDLDDPDAEIKTKGVFSNLIAHVGGIEFKFGTGGVHASVPKQKIVASNEWRIIDIDVAAMYPNIAIVNGLAPEHLGTAFTAVYAQIPVERATHAKGTYANGALKLASNGPWGQSNNKYSVFYDPKYAMTIPVNGQLMICMLAERLVEVPTVRLIAANTDGVTYMIHRDMIPQALAHEQGWERITGLKLEYAEYNRMWIRDVNNYIGEYRDD